MRPKILAVCSNKTFGRQSAVMSAVLGGISEVANGTIKRITLYLIVAYQLQIFII